MWGLCGGAGRRGGAGFETRCITRNSKPGIFSASCISRFVPAQTGLLLKGIRKMLQIVSPLYHSFMQLATTITSHWILFVPFQLLDFYNWSRYLFLSPSVCPVFSCSLAPSNSPAPSCPAPPPPTAPPRPTAPTCPALSCPAPPCPAPPPPTAPPCSWSHPQPPDSHICLL